MSISKKLNISGGVLLLIGILLSLSANNYVSNASILLADRVTVKDLSDTSSATIKITNQINISNNWFIAGIAFTFIGIVLQIGGTIAKEE